MPATTASKLKRVRHHRIVATPTRVPSGWNYIRKDLVKNITSLRNAVIASADAPTFSHAERVCEFCCIIVGDIISADFFLIEVDFPEIISLFRDGEAAVHKVANLKTGAAKTLLEHYAGNIAMRINVLRALGSEGWESARRVLDAA